MEIFKSIKFDSPFTSTPQNHDVIKNLNKEEIPLKDTGIPPRIFYHWKKCGLINRSKNTDGKRKWEILSFVEFVWLKCIKEMRDFGVSFDIIKQVQEILFEDFDLEKTKDLMHKMMEDKLVLKNYKSAVNKMVQEIKLGDLSEYNKAKLISTLTNVDSLIDEVIKPYAFKNIEIFILNSILVKHEYGILINSEKVVPFLFEGLKEGHQDAFKKLFLDSHIYISITRKYFQFLSDDITQKYLSKFSLLNAYEKEIFDFLQKEEFQEIKIRMDNAQIIISGKLKIPYKSEGYHEWKRSALLKYPYCEITEKQHNGKISSVEIAVKELIQK